MLPEGERPKPSLKDYLQVLRRHRLTLALSILVVAGAAVGVSLLQTPVYSASAEVLLQPRATESIFDPSTGQRNDPERALQTQIRIIKSEPVVAAVRERLGYDAEVSAVPAGRTDVILVKGESTVPRRAADIANAYATAYLDFKRKQTVDDLLAAAKEVQSQVDDLQKQVDASTGPARDALIQQQALFKNKLDELQVDAALRSGGAQLVTRAPVPTEPVRPKPVRAGVMASGLGLLMGIGLAFLIEHLDDSVKNKDDLEQAAPSLPVLGLIPLLPSWKNRAETHLVSLTEPTSPGAEAYRTVRTSIQFLGLDRSVRSLQFTSPSASEGKTTTLANLAVAMARTGQRVVMMCCDLRRPRVHEFFGLSNSVGLTSVLLGKVTLNEALQRVPNVHGLYLLASGPLPPNPSELLSSRKWGRVLDELRADESVLLLLDSPPVLPVTDALVLSQRVDATLLVTVAGSTTRKGASRAVELLRQVDAPLLGSVLIGVSPDGSYNYGYGYNYYSPTSAGSTNGSQHRGRRKRRKNTARISA